MTLTHAAALKRAADLIDDCGWAAEADGLAEGGPYNTYRAIQGACLLLRDEVPDSEVPTSFSVRLSLRTYLGLASLYAWEADKTQAEVLSTLREAATALSNPDDNVIERLERLREGRS